MIILDTGVWIEYLKTNQEYKPSIDIFLKNKGIIAFDYIFGELLQGAKNHEKKRIVDIWKLLPKVEIPHLGFLAGSFAMEHDLYNKGIGLIDSAIIYSTIQLDFKLWTLDKKIINFIDKKYLYN